MGNCNFLDGNKHGVVQYYKQEGMVPHCEFWWITISTWCGLIIVLSGLHVTWGIFLQVSGNCILVSGFSSYTYVFETPPLSFFPIL